MESYNKIDSITLEITNTEKRTVKKEEVENAIKEIEKEIKERKDKIDLEYLELINYLKEQLLRFN